MKNQLIAVAIQTDGTISPHAGRAEHWRVYATQGGASTPQLVWNIVLTPSSTLHEWHVKDDSSRHPLHSVDIAIALSGGDGVRTRLAERETILVDTQEADPEQAVIDFLKGELATGKGHQDELCLDPENHHQRHQSNQAS